MDRQDIGMDGSQVGPLEDAAADVHSASAEDLRSSSEAPATTPRPTFAEVYDGHFRAVWLALRRFGVWERDLDDAAHDVFIVVHRRLDDFDGNRPVRPWLFGIAARVASEFRRRSQHRHEVVSEDTSTEAGRLRDSTWTHTPAMGIPADRAVDDKERRDLLHRALEHLDFDRRTVLVLHDIEGHAMPEISAVLEVNINTLYARLRQARVDLKTAVLALSGVPS